ncbi:hypothetical protein ACLVWU_00460 [Bdellovibrio sp. HCB290]|uniref:hypothetical protein n=1 Tax=Bdellovibrio sp. HCB290 TaxID=3394356 RepID=UPI0039B419A0
MMKTMVISILLLGSLSAQAETLTTIGWGRDGATLASMPAKDSIQLAAEVYEALGGSGEKLDFEADDFAIEANQDGISIVVAGKGVQVSKNASNNMDVKLQGSVAEYLYENLNVAPTNRVGASSKQAGNVVCAQGMGSGGKKLHQCIVYNVLAVQMSN